MDFQYQNQPQQQHQPQTHLKTSSLSASSNLTSNSTANVASNANLGYQPLVATSTLTSSVSPINNNNQLVKKVIHFTSDCKILGELIIK